MPHPNAPVTTRLSPTASNTRPTNNSQTDNTGVATNARDSRYTSAETAAVTSPAMTARLPPRMSAKLPAQARDNSAAANCAPTTRPITNVPIPSVSCR
jgi:hypothetical protein